MLRGMHDLHRSELRENVGLLRKRLLLNVIYKYYRWTLSRAFLLGAVYGNLGAPLGHSAEFAANANWEKLLGTAPALVINDPNTFPQCYEPVGRDLPVLFVQAIGPVHIDVNHDRWAQTEMQARIVA